MNDLWVLNKTRMLKPTHHRRQDSSQWPALNKNQGTTLSAEALPSTREVLHHEDSEDRNGYDVGVALCLRSFENLRTRVTTPSWELSAKEYENDEHPLADNPSSIISF